MEAPFAQISAVSTSTVVVPGMAHRMDTFPPLVAADRTTRRTAHPEGVLPLHGPDARMRCRTQLSGKKPPHRVLVRADLHHAPCRRFAFPCCLGRQAAMNRGEVCTDETRHLRQIGKEAPAGREDLFLICGIAGFDPGGAERTWLGKIPSRDANAPAKRGRPQRGRLHEDLQPQLPEKRQLVEVPVHRPDRLPLQLEHVDAGQRDRRTGWRQSGAERSKVGAAHEPFDRNAATTLCGTYPLEHDIRKGGEESLQIAHHGLAVERSVRRWVRIAGRWRQRGQHGIRAVDIPGLKIPMHHSR
jgi:hypothetical protein